MSSFAEYIRTRWYGYVDTHGVPIFPGDIVYITCGSFGGYRGTANARRLSTFGHMMGFIVSGLFMKNGDIPVYSTWVWCANLELSVPDALKRLRELEEAERVESPR